MVVPSIVVMGVAGSGKTTVGKSVATHLGLDFYDGDDFHPARNVQKMSSGYSLTDEDRADWLSALAELIKGKGPIVLACSALKARYRERLAQSDNRLRFVFLDVSPEIARSRLKSRDSHFMPASLIDSQFEILERPQDAIEIDAENGLVQVLDELKLLLS
tara:strand:- start:108 stop:587 length:480 start_codon:yes stop_codon:yes gene_type:complete